MPDFMLITTGMVVVFDFMTCVGQQVNLPNVFRSLTSMLVQTVWNMTGNLASLLCHPVPVSLI